MRIELEQLRRDQLVATGSDHDPVLGLGLGLKLGLGLRLGLGEQQLE